MACMHFAKLSFVAMNELWKKSKVAPLGMRRPWKWPVEPAVAAEADGVRTYVSSPHPSEQSPARHKAGNKQTKDECPSWNPSAGQSQGGSFFPQGKEEQEITTNGSVISLKRSSRNRCIRSFWVNGYINGKTVKVRIGRRNIWRFIFKPVLFCFFSLLFRLINLFCF